LFRKNIILDESAYFFKTHYEYPVKAICEKLNFGFLA